jgi:hypothetical protein
MKRVTCERAMSGTTLFRIYSTLKRKQKMKPLGEEEIKKLKEAGRQDLIYTHNLLMTGYAGVNKKGKIVDRRIDPEAMPIQPGGPGDAPPPKPVKS